MVQTLWISAGLSLAEAVVFCCVGWVVSHRTSLAGDTRASHLAAGMFAVLWYGLAAMGTLEGFTKAWVAIGEPGVSLVVAAQLLGFLALCAAMAGLMYYLVYLFTGHDQAFWPLIVGYAVLGGWLVRTAVAQAPVAFHASPWRVWLVFDQPAASPLTLLPVVVLLLPPLLASVALFGLVPRLPRGPLRMRVLVVACSLMVALGAAVLDTIVRINDEGTRVTVQTLLGILAGTAILIAHRPPRWLPFLTSAAPADGRDEGT